jgi:hypothetical protein
MIPTKTYFLAAFRPAEGIARQNPKDPIAFLGDFSTGF